VPVKDHQTDEVEAQDVDVLLPSIEEEVALEREEEERRWCEEEEERLRKELGRVQERETAECQRMLAVALDVEEAMQRTVMGVQSTAVGEDSTPPNPSQQERVPGTSNPLGPGHTEHPTPTANSGRGNEGVARHRKAPTVAQLYDDTNQINVQPGPSGDANTFTNTEREIEKQHRKNVRSPYH